MDKEKFDAKEILQLNNSNIPKAKAKEYQRINETTFFETKFNFLSAHNGLRPGRVHLMIGPSGSGKSTLLMSVISQAARTCRVVAWLSEELSQDFDMRLSRLNLESETLSNIFKLSEIDEGFPDEARENIKKYRPLIENTLISHRPHVVVLDNLSTSPIYQVMNPGLQAYHCDWLKRMAAKIGFALVVCSHVKKGVSDNTKLLELDDIKGYSGLVNLAEYGYTYQKIMANGRHFPIIRSEKGRFHSSKKFYSLNYDQNKNTYLNDEEIGFSEVKKIFGLRDKI